MKIWKLYGNCENSGLYLHSKFTRTIEKYDIICATPETIYRYFTFAYLTSSFFEWIILDECHHCRESDFYNKLLRHFIFAKGENPNIKILGLTASPCDDKSWTEEKLTHRIQEWCNNMNSHLACPRNIINTENVDNKKEISFWPVNSPSDKEDIENTTKIKNTIFHRIMMPILDWHFHSIYKKWISKISSNSSENSKVEWTEEQKDIKEKRKRFDKNLKEQIKQFIVMYIMNFYLTWFVEEDTQLDEKHWGIYTKIDKTLLMNYKQFLKESHYSTQDFYFIKQGKLEELIAKISDFESENEDIEAKINFSYEFKENIKRIKEDIIMKEMKKYSKWITLIIKYLDTDSIIFFTRTIFQQIEMNIYPFHNQEITSFDNKNESYIEMISQKFMASKTLNQDLPVYTSSYLKSIVKFLIETQATDSKTILFVNHRLFCKELNRKIQKILSENEATAQLSSTYVLGIASSDTSLWKWTFTEVELKENISRFRDNPNCKLLIATNVVEEGIDIPQCNNIICLNEIVTIKEYIQKTGRARKENSKIFFFSSKENENVKKEHLNQIETSMKVMKHIVKDNTIIPKIENISYINNYNFYETLKGAKVFIGYANKIVKEFISKLFNDGYDYVRPSEGLDKTSSGKYIPYLLLPSVWEASYRKIYDNKKQEFNSEKAAKDYYSKYEEYYYLTAIKLLHKHGFLDDFLQFNKNYDDLISLENNYVNCESEKRIKIKEKIEAPNTNEEYIEYIAHILHFTPNYFDINYNENPTSPRYITLLSDMPLSLVNFDLFLPSTLLLKLYFFNTTFNENNSYKQWFKKKNKIPYSIFSKININMSNVTRIKIPKNKIPLINFFYIYSLFVATDAEMFFYYSLYTKKFDFCVNKELFSDPKIWASLDVIFKKYTLEYLSKKQHLKNLSLIKFSIIRHDIEKDIYFFDFDYIDKCYKNVVNDIYAYEKFVTRCLMGEETRKKLLKDPEYLSKKEADLAKNPVSDLDSNTGIICRNFFNFSKLIIMHYSTKDIKGSTKHRRFANYNYQQYFLHTYGILTENRDYKKCWVLDYNMKIMRYKINLKHLGEVHRNKKFSSYQMIKKFHFFPNEVLQEIHFATFDQWYLFTLFPVILFKIQNSLIYYYHSNCWMNEFKSSIGKFEKIDIKLLTQSWNSKGTMEVENYERLEFLGDSILKFLSSVELFVQLPHANRDLLFNKRRVIENNKYLCEKAKEHNLYNYWFTSPVTIKRVMIPGFTKDESLIFDISYNRSFTKNCYVHNRETLDEDSNYNEKKERDKDQKNNNENNKSKSKGIELINEDEMENEKANDKRGLDIEYDPENKFVDAPETELIVSKEEIQKTINKIDIVNVDTRRFIYTKTVADIVESWTGFVFKTTQLNIGDSNHEALNTSSIFLKEIDVLTNTFNDTLKLLTQVGITGLKNENCKYSQQEQENYLRIILDNPNYHFTHSEILMQAMTHSTHWSEECQSNNFNYVNKSYQRLSFLGEAILSLYVSLYVYSNNPHENECSLHKMRICGINHNIISIIALNLKLDDCLWSKSKEIKGDISKYKRTYLEQRNIQETTNKNEDGVVERSWAERKYKLPKQEILDEAFVIILCELFHAYIGAIFVDSADIKACFKILDKELKNYLDHNATKTTYTEHPKVTIWEEYRKRSHYFKKIRENGGNRIWIKYNDKSEKYRNRKMYNYQLIIDKYIIYEENIKYNRSTIKVAQEKAKNVFLLICKEIDRRETLKINWSKFDLESIMKYIGIKYRTV